MSRDAKQALIDALDKTDFSEELAAALARKLPEVAAVAMPTTIEEAIIVTGQVNANFNNQFLVTFSGLPLYELLLKAGQLNKVHQNMLLTNLAYLGPQGISSIIAPVEGGVYYGYFDGWRVKVDGKTPKSVSVTCNKQTEPMKPDGGDWTCQFPIPIGKQTGIVSMAFDGGKSQQESVNFEVKHWEDMPATLSGDTLTIASGESTGHIESITFEYGGETYQFTKEQYQCVLKLRQEIAEEIAQKDALDVRLKAERVGSLLIKLAFRFV